MFRVSSQGPWSFPFTCSPVLPSILLLAFAAAQGLVEAKFDVSLITEKTRRYTYVNNFHAKKFTSSSSVACPKEVVFDPRDVVKVDESTLTYGAGAISINSAGDPCTQAERYTLMKYTGGGSSSVPDSDVKIYLSHLTPDSLGRVSGMFASPAAPLMTCPITLASDVVFVKNGRKICPSRWIGPISFIVSPSTLRIANGLALKGDTLHLFMSCPECTSCTPAVGPTDCSCLYEGGSVAPSSSSSGGKVRSHVRQDAGTGNNVDDADLAAMLEAQSALADALETLANGTSGDNLPSGDPFRNVTRRDPSGNATPGGTGNDADDGNSGSQTSEESSAESSSGNAVGGSVAPSSSSEVRASVAPPASSTVGSSVAPSSSSEVKATSGDSADNEDDEKSTVDGGASIWVWLGPVLGAFATILAGSFVFCAVRCQGQAPQRGVQ